MESAVAAESNSSLISPDSLANGRAVDVAHHVLSAQALLEPVRPGLQQVEARLRAVDGSLFAPLSNAFLNLIGSGGKRLRPALALLAAGAGGSDFTAGVDDRVVALAASVEMLHTSTLVHDDVIDGALLRRGAPTLNATWSGGATVLAGNYMFGAAAQLAAETQNMTVIHLFSDTLKVIVDGELRQLLDRFQYDQPKENYYQRIYAKTASLFCAATQGAAVLTHQDPQAVEALRSYGYSLGMAFQIVDDILDFTGDPGLLGKPAGSDLQQGTLTLPFFHYLRGLSNPNALISQMEEARTLAEEGDSAAWQALVAEIAQDLRASPALAASTDEARRLLDSARSCLAPFADTPYRRSMFALCDFVVGRTY
jgi:geranylgeranyl pyrophosphate synthase